MALSQQQALLLSEKHGQYAVGLRPVPTPGPGDVLIEVHAAGLNGIDNYIRFVGAFIDTFPAVTGHEGAGVVKTVGKDVAEFTEGDHVIFECWFSADRGTYQQYCLADAQRVTKIPSSLSFDAAATLPVSFATAAVGLYAPKSKRGGAGLTPFWEEGGKGKYASEPIVVLGGSSCVGQLTIQLAKLSGFNPIISTCSKHNIDYVKQAGATHVIDYRETAYADLPAAIAKITSKPCRLVYDAISTEETQKAGWNALAPNGSICVLLPPHDGRYGEEAEDGKRTVYVFGNVNDPEHIESGFGRTVSKKLEKFMEEGIIRPTRVEVVPGGLQGVPAGLERLMTGKVSGTKLVVHPQQSATSG
ncbi:GroES-like protein [Dentipellis sp. KUC8613]|nr:GroES-like protein [Dentipellis sp. KUC8613]